MNRSNVLFYIYCTSHTNTNVSQEQGVLVNHPRIPVTTTPLSVSVWLNTLNKQQEHGREHEHRRC